jgi:modulator of FtsH protease
MALTAVACLGITLYALFAKTDFTAWGAGILMALLVIMAVSILAIFLPKEYAKPVEIGICGISIFVVGIVIIMDLQLIIGGK